MPTDPLPELLTSSRPEDDVGEAADIPNQPYWQGKGAESPVRRTHRNRMKSLLNTRKPTPQTA